MPKERRGNLKSRSDIILAADAHIGHRIHVRRRLMDLSQSTLAEKLGINAARLSVCPRSLLRAHSAQHQADHGQSDEGDRCSVIQFMIAHEAPTS
jgi:hypothetical protein